jgi:hypothetical protein
MADKAVALNYAADAALLRKGHSQLSQYIVFADEESAREGGARDACITYEKLCAFILSNCTVKQLQADGQGNYISKLKSQAQAYGGGTGRAEAPAEEGQGVILGTSDPSQPARNGQHALHGPRPQGG